MPLTRSENMSRIRGRDTGPEIFLRAALDHAHLHPELYGQTPAGRPDLVFPGERLAIFIDGCFWHGCPVHYVRPRTREDFWAAKLRANVDRDRAQTATLEALGWRVLHVWEHEVYESTAEVIAAAQAALRDPTWVPAPALRVARVQGIDDSLNLERRHMEDLRDPSSTSVIEGRRTTRKWRRPKSLG